MSIIDYEKMKVHRLVHAGTDIAALGKYLISKLQIKPLPKVELLQLGKKQGYTPATTREQLQMMKVAKLVEFYLDEDSDSITVRLTDNALQLVEGALS